MPRRIVKRVPHWNADAWVRTCQECGHKQQDAEPQVPGEMTSAYRDRKCKKCKSEALDYGTHKA
jgi:hypothetical protein